MQQPLLSSPTKRIHDQSPKHNDNLSEGELILSKELQDNQTHQKADEKIATIANQAALNISAWGDPPLSNSTPQTSAWGAPSFQSPTTQTQVQTIPQQQTVSASAWGDPQPTQQQQSSGWGDPQPAQQQQQSSGWGDSQPQKQTTTSSSWDQGSTTQASGNNSWGDPAPSFGGGGGNGSNDYQRDRGERGERGSRGGRGGNRGGGGAGGNSFKSDFEVMVRGLLPDTSENDLYDYFEYCGKVVSVKLLKNPEGASKCMAFVKFETEEVMNNAISFNGDTCNGVTFKIERTKPREPRDGQSNGGGSSGFGGSGFDNSGQERRPPRDRNAETFTVFIGSLSFKSTEQSVKGFFSDCGNVLEVRFIKNEEGKSKGFGYVEFENQEGQTKALEKNGQSLDGRNVKVDMATKKGGKRQNGNESQANGGSTSWGGEAATGAGSSW